MTTYSRIQNAPGLVVATDGTVSQFLTMVHSINCVGTNTLNFKKLNKRTLPANYVTFQVVKRNFGNQRTTNFYPNGTTSSSSTQQCFATDFSNPAALKLEADKKAKRKALDQLSDMKVNVAQMWAEREQTVQLIGSTARRLATAYSALRRGALWDCVRNLGVSKIYVEKRSRKAVESFYYAYPRNPKDAAASMWLELQYGWKPLLQDVYGSAERVAQAHSEKEFPKGFFTLKAARSATKVYTAPQPGGKGSFSYQTTHARALSAYSFSYLVDNSLLRQASTMGMTNPGLLAWELIPYSFVVDWFLPVGKWLEATTAAYGLSFLRGTNSIKYHSVSSGTAYVTNKIGDWAPYSVTNYQYGPVESIDLIRTVIFAFPSNPLPSFKNPVSVTHALNAIALLALAFKR